MEMLDFKSELLSGDVRKKLVVCLFVQQVFIQQIFVHVFIKHILHAKYCATCKIK